MFHVKQYQVVEDFEAALAEYAGANYAVTTTSCTMAILLACYWCRHHGYETEKVLMPKRTYVGVPMSVRHAGYQVHFIDSDWSGAYPLTPLSVIDSARRFTSGMCELDTSDEMRCVSFHWSKHLAIGQGGAILLYKEETADWLKRARFDGRNVNVPPDDASFNHLGFHAYMSPRDAADGLSRIAVLPENNINLPNDDYPDLSKMECFQ